MEKMHKYYIYTLVYGYNNFFYLKNVSTPSNNSVDRGCVFRDIGGILEVSLSNKLPK